MRRLCAALALLGVTVLAGCGNGPNQEIARAMLAQARLSVGKSPQAPAPLAGLTRAQVDALGVPLLRVTAIKLKTQALLGVYGTNGPVTTWSTTDKTSVALNGGIVVATRGLPGDLMSAAVPSLAEIAAGAGVLARTHYYLGRNDQTEPVVFRCTLADAGAEQITVVGLAYRTRHVTETCAAGPERFTNDYWIDARGTLRRSVQWISPQTGALEIENLEN